MFKSVSTIVDFPVLEKELLKKWEKEGIIEDYLHRNDSSDKRFSFLDGPITANNPMGIHHAWGRTYKDVWQRFWNMRGYRQRFQNGFDCQGLWVEVEVEKELGIKNKKDIENLVPNNKKESIAKFVELCKERVLKFSAIQTEQSKRLGYFMDWDNSYYTMSDENNYMIWYFLKVCFQKGWIYKGRDSVPWCPRCQTAISQHEMLTEDYKEVTHETIFAKFPIQSSGWEDTSVLIWTTTPWTLPANVGIGININFLYGVWENKNTHEKLIFISQDENKKVPMRVLKGKEVSIEDYVFSSIDNAAEFRKVRDITGEQLLGLSYSGAFDHLPIVKKAEQENKKTFHTIVDGSKIVVSTEGTGLLHVAPGAGKEDFDLGKEKKFSIISPINDEAVYVDDMGELSGKNAKKHPEIIFDFLKAKTDTNFIFKTMLFTHRYPACWRCKSELVWKVTDEWYIGMDIPENKEGETLREQMKKTARMIEWNPSFGLDRELDWLSNMHDWLISKKNRYWGLALPIYECKNCGNFDVLGSRNELKARAVSGWKEFESHSPHKPYIDEISIRCINCQEVVTRIDDVGNVWLDAGIVPFSTYIDPQTSELSYTSDKIYWQSWFPADFITESFPGQFKNWFYSLIAMSTVLEKKNSFKTLLGFSTMVDEKGEAFHKSKGNAIEFVEGADTFGADVLRWICSQHDITSNIQFGSHLADQTRRKFLMLWNIYNFFILNANVDSWEFNSSIKPPVSILDKWILSRLHQTIHLTTRSLEVYDAYGACNTLESLINDMSLWYIRRSRERVGVSAESQEEKNAFYTTTYVVLTELVKLLAPFIPFISDNIYINLTNEKSVHLTSWPIYHKEVVDELLVEQMQQVRKIVELGLAARKQFHLKVRQPLAKITVYSGKTEAKIVNELQYLILEELNIKEVVFVDSHSEETSIILDVELTDKLKSEGNAREIIRQIQEERKKLGTTPFEKVKVILPFWPREFEHIIKKKAVVEVLSLGEIFSVEKL